MEIFENKESALRRNQPKTKNIGLSEREIRPVDGEGALGFEAVQETPVQNYETSSKEYFHRAQVNEARLAHDAKFHQLIHLLVDYWEMKPSLYEERLRGLVHSGAKRVSTFVPWSHFETDIHHSFKKFLKAAVAAKMKVRLLVLPSLGLNYPYSGIPKDIIQNPGNLAIGRDGRPVLNMAAPHIFCLPTFFSTEVVKRFGNFLLKLNGILHEVFQEAGHADFCEIVISDGLFPYYQSRSGGEVHVGDFSAAQILAYREFLDREYLGAYGETFKSQSYDFQNRHRFLAHVERNLQEKSELIFSRKNSYCKILKTKFMNLECAPSLMEQSLLCEMFDAKPSVQRYFDAILSSTETGRSVFLSASGTLRRFSEKEKAFLVMASLIHGGDVMINAHFNGSASVQQNATPGHSAEESSPNISGLSVGFIAKLRSLSNMLLRGGYGLHKQVTYLASGPLALHAKILSSARAMIPSLFEVSSFPLDAPATNHKSTRLFFVDPGALLRLVDMVQLFGLAQAGKVVVLPALPASEDHTKDIQTSYLPEAAEQLERFRKTQRPIRINMGVAYEVYEYHSGYVILYDAAAFRENPAAPAAKIPELNAFTKAMLNLSEVGPICFVEDARVRAGFFQRDAQNNGSSATKSDSQPEFILFLMNPTQENIVTKVRFNQPVGLTAFPANAVAEPMEGEVFELQVPALGVLSLGCSPQAESQFSKESGAAAEFDSLVDVIGQGSAHQWN